MLSRIRHVEGKVLDRPSYHALRSREAEHLTRPIWKLERAQYFHEPDDDPCWQGFLADDWARVRTAFENERDGPLPEVVVDEHALYHVSYDDDWRACGARRIDEADVMEQATAEIAELWDRAEPLWPYFQREIAHLTPPV